MRNDYGYGKRHLSGGWIVLIVICAALVYAGILLGIRIIGHRLEYGDVQEQVGSLDGRFDLQTVTMEYDGRTWTYRQRELTNLLLIGVDWMESDEASVRYAGQADFLLLLTLDKRNRTISALQLDRDTVTDIRVYGPFGDYMGIARTQLCLSYAYGATPAESAQHTAWAVRRMLGGIPIDGCLVMTMGGIVALNDVLGGVEVTLEDDFSALDPQMTKGTTLRLQGRQAEIFVRSRMNLGDGTNESRMRRQRMFIQEAGRLFLQGVNRDMDFAATVLDALSDYVTTDMDRSWLINKVYASRSYKLLDIRTPAGTHSVGADGFMEFHMDAVEELLTSAYFE